MAKNIYLTFTLFVILFQASNVRAHNYLGSAVSAPISFLEITRKTNGLNLEIKESALNSAVYCKALNNGATQLFNTLNKGIAELKSDGVPTRSQNNWMIYEKDHFKHHLFDKIIGFGLLIAVLLLILGFI